MSIIIYLMILIIFAFLIRNIIFKKNLFESEHFHENIEDEDEPNNGNNPGTNDNPITGGGGDGVGGGNNPILGGGDDGNVNNPDNGNNGNNPANGGGGNQGTNGNNVGNNINTTSVNNINNGNGNGNGNSPQNQPGINTTQIIFNGSDQTDISVNNLPDSTIDELQRIPPIVRERDLNNRCCGVNIYSKELKNINRCVVQHIKKIEENKDQPKYIGWKELDESNTCGNAHKILVKTSNCTDIANIYNKNIESILEKMNSESLDGCECNFFNSEKDDDISDEDKLNIFRLNTACSKRIGGQRIAENGYEQYEETPYKYQLCTLIRDTL